MCIASYANRMLTKLVTAVYNTFNLLTRTHFVMFQFNSAVLFETYNIQPEDSALTQPPKMADLLLTKRSH